MKVMLSFLIQHRGIQSEQHRKAFTISNICHLLHGEYLLSIFVALKIQLLGILTILCNSSENKHTTHFAHFSESLSPLRSPSPAAVNHISGQLISLVLKASKSIHAIADDKTFSDQLDSTPMCEPITFPFSSHLLMNT